MATKIAMQIDNVSQALVKEAVQTMPFFPVYAKISMDAEGISPPAYNEEAGLERYISECVERNIIPASVSTLYYDDVHDLFVPRAGTAISISSCGMTAIKTIRTTTRTAVEMMLKGGKPFRVNIETGSMTAWGTERARQGFSAFRETFLDTLLDNGYRLSEGDFWLGAWHSRQHYSEGYSKSGGLEFNEKSLKLGLLEETPYIIAWFDALKAKYDSAA